MNTSDKHNEAQLERTLRELFHEDVEMNDRSKSWWSKAVYRATEHPQRRGFLGMRWMNGLRPLPALAMSLALVFMIGGGVVFAAASGMFSGAEPGVGDDPGLLARDADGPPLDSGMAMCLSWDMWVESAGFALDGTVKNIEVRDVPNEFEPGHQEYLVTFDVNEWYRGGEGGEVSVWFSSRWLAESDMILAADDAELVNIGTRLLVSGDSRNGGPALEDPAAATMCGGTKFHTSELADEWAADFAA